MLDKKTCSIVLFLIFSNFVFGPLVLYLTNLDLFWFSISKFSIGIIITAVCAYSILLGFLLILKRINPRAIRPTMAVIFALSLALYIQGNFLVKQYGVLNGTDIDWAQYRGYGVFNTLLWIGLIVTILFIYYKFNERAIKGFAIASIFLVLMQVSTLGVMLLSYESPEKLAPALSGENMLSVSNEKNVVVFVLDTFDAAVFNKILADNPEYKDKFEGFTYYKNMLGAFPTTKAAIPQILTGKVYLNQEPYSNFINHIYDEAPLFKELKSNNYDIRINTGEMFLPINGEKYFDNFYKSRYGVSSYTNLYQEIYQITSFRYVPHVIKKYFITDTSSIEKLKESTFKEGINPNYAMNDSLFLKALKERGLSLESKNKAFRFIHLWGMHPPFNTDEKLQKSSRGSDVSAARGALYVVEEYIRQLKALNVYDETAIIVMADHGYYEMRQKPLFLYKGFDSNSKFAINNINTSYMDIQSSLISIFSDNYSLYGQSFITGEYIPSKEGSFYFYPIMNRWDDEYLSEIEEYKFIGNNMDYAYGVKIYKPQNIQEKMDLFVDLSTDGRIASIFDKRYRIGFLESEEKGGVWSKEKSKFIFDYYDKDNLMLSIDFIKLSSEYKPKVYFNDHYLCDLKAQQTIILPAGLMNENGRQTITIETPNIKSPLELGQSSDYNKYGVYIKTANLKKEKIESLEFNKNIAEINRDNIGSYMASGWNGVEKKGVWSTGEAALKFEYQSKKQISIKIQGMPLTPDGDTQIYLNDHLIANFEDGKIITLPTEYINANGKQELKFITLNATSPKVLGASADERQLGIFINKITFTLGK